MQYLTSAAAQSQPFLLFVSLVNPHDVLFYPKTYTAGGYDESWLEGEIGAPATATEDLSTKPSVQEQFLRLFNASGPIPTPQMKRNYLNFYGNLMKSSDAYLVKILDALARAGCWRTRSVIATADHGEMGTTHGGMRQKNFNFYEESTRVPLVYSNPRLFKQPETQPLARLPRRLPAHAREPGRRARPTPAPTGRGSTTPTEILAARAGPAQDYVVFTYDDWQSGQARAPTRSRRTTSSASASSATSSPATTTPTATSPTSGRCTTSRPTRSSARTSRTGAHSARPRSSANTGGCGASSRGRTDAAAAAQLRAPRSATAPSGR